MLTDKETKTISYIVSGRMQRSRIRTSFLLTLALCGVIVFLLNFEKKILIINERACKQQLEELSGYRSFTEREEEMKSALLENYRAANYIARDAAKKNFQLLIGLLLAMIIMSNIAVWGVVFYEGIIKKLTSGRPELNPGKQKDRDKGKR